VLYLTLRYNNGWRYMLSEQLWFPNPNFKAKQMKYFDTKNWQVDTFPYLATESQFVTLEEFEKFTKFT